MATEFNTRIKFKRDTSSNWTNKNPVILNGEIILVDTDSGELRAKIGDGSKTYTQLPFSDEVIRNLIPTDLSELNQDSTHRLVTDSEKQTWNNKSDFDGDYNNLTNKPSIPIVSSSVTSTSTTTAASSSAVKEAYDLAESANSNANNANAIARFALTTAEAVQADYMPERGGTFTGSVYASDNDQSYSSSLLRNSKLVSSETTPTYNGEIYWVYG